MRTRTVSCCAALMACALLSARVALAQEAAAPTAPEPAPPVASAAEPSRAAVTDVEIERIKPHKENHPTLRFLKENRGFIRARFDMLREKPVAQKDASLDIDPRFLAYRDMLANILAGRDSVAAAEDRRQRLALLTSVTQLGDLEAQLDALERLLAEQRNRLGVLQADFTGDQQTALMVVASGYPGDAVLTQISITLDDRSTLTVPLSGAQQQSLRTGGSVQLFHGFVEPREQLVTVGVSGDRWPDGDAGYATLEPTRDRLTLLRLDLSRMSGERGAPSIAASTWLHDAEISSREP